MQQLPPPPAISPSQRSAFRFDGTLADLAQTEAVRRKTVWWLCCTCFPPGRRRAGNCFGSPADDLDVFLQPQITFNRQAWTQRRLADGQLVGIAARSSARAVE
jgi:hypothetical protein